MMGFLSPIEPYIALIKAIAVVGAVVALVTWGYRHGEAHVQGKWDAEKVALAIAQEKRTLRDLENSSQADTAITHRLNDETSVQSRIQQRITNAQIQSNGTACVVPHDLGLLLNAAASGIDVTDGTTTGGPDGQAQAASPSHP